MCPGTLVLKESLHLLFDNNAIYYITFKQWMAADRTTLETLTKSASEFVEYLIEKLNILIPHAFISSEQSSFFKSLKSNLKDEEYLIISDFAENYAFVVQDHAQGFHWTNNQATLHPFMIYYCERGTIKHISYNPDKIEHKKCLSDFCDCYVDNNVSYFKCRNFGNISILQSSFLKESLKSSGVDIRETSYVIIEHSNLGPILGGLNFSINTKVRILFMNFCKITAVSENAFNLLIHLTRLKMGNNFIKSIPFNLFYPLPNLTQLSLEHNNITEMYSRYFEKNKDLEVLDISHNPIERISLHSHELGPSIREIHATDIDLTYDTLFNLTVSSDIKALFIDGNNVGFFPVKYINIAEKLTGFSLEDNPLSCSCFNKPTFTWLNSWATWLTKVSGTQTIHKAVSLSDLNITQCYYPEEYRGRYITSLNPKEMDTWCLDYCNVRPPCSCQSTPFNDTLSINCIYARYNQLKNTGLLNVKFNKTYIYMDHIYFINNSLDMGLFENMNPLKLLIYHSNIDHLSSNTISKVKEVQILSLFNDGINYIKEDAFIGGAKLVMINLKSNKITEIARNTFSKDRLPKLQMIDISFNQILSMENIALGSQIIFINLISNNINKLALPTFKSISNLKALFIGENNISCDCQFYSVLSFISKSVHFSNTPTETEMSDICCILCKDKNLTMNDFYYKEKKTKHCENMIRSNMSGYGIQTENLYQNSSDSLFEVKDTATDSPVDKKPKDALVLMIIISSIVLIVITLIVTLFYYKLFLARKEIIKAVPIPVHHEKPMEVGHPHHGTRHSKEIKDDIKLPKEYFDYKNFLDSASNQQLK
ncbi:uncharacterized protein LOC135922157 [Gordionus sp. m RMFG-2023]|uniref:uncharacterized protein LOC135922157 n=1 Tax=Gordionus sp. m RMFG-2023 TaxID=3053472 RepID=UPI0031FE16D1